MKKLTMLLLTALMVMAFMPSHVQAVTEKGKTTVVAIKTVVSPEESALVARLEEIKAMDVSTMTSVEKRALRHELRDIKGTLNTMHGGVVYISAGGLVVLILLLIILL